MPFINRNLNLKIEYKMKTKFKLAIEDYQCPGCVVDGVGCGKHHAGTMSTDVGNSFFGMPRGFNRLDEYKKLKPNIYDTFENSEQ